MSRQRWRGESIRSFNIADGEVHVWMAGLDLPAQRIAEYHRLLSNDEQARMERFRFLRDKHHHTVSRGLLRSILGSYLQMEPQALDFCYGAHGKPQLAQHCGGGSLTFNVSHSNNLALFAVTRGREVGVDVEYLRPDLPVLELSARFFSAREAALLAALPPGLRCEAFHTCWTRKEAYLKACGVGLMAPLDDADVGLSPNDDPALPKTNWPPRESTRWIIHALNPHPEYVASLAVLTPNCRIHCGLWAERQC
jgi:4'-phosphopantetheinyl transferase